MSPLPRWFCRTICLLLVCLALLSAAMAKGQIPADATIKSPDGKIVFTLKAGEQMKYSVAWNARVIIRDAALAFPSTATIWE